MYFFFLGDFFDNRQLLDINVLNTGIDIVIELADILPIYFLTGNHDIYKKYDTDINSIVAFRYIPNVTIYEKPVIITNKESKILVLPWINTTLNEEKYLLANTYDYVFAHANISGFKFDNGKDISSSVATDFFKFKNIKRLFSGHIHKRQTINNFTYIGSPYHTKRSDIGNTKGLYIFDPKENSFEFTLNEFSPIYQRVLLENMLELSLNETIKSLNNNYTDIIVPDKYIHLFNLTKFIDILKDCKYKSIITVTEINKFENELSEVLTEIETKDILTLLESNIEELGHQTETLVKLKLLNKKYFEKASKEDIQ